MPSLRLQSPFPYQRELIYAKERFLLVKGGRRAGKSLGVTARQAAFAFKTGSTLNWCLDRTLRDARKWFRYYMRLMPREALRDVSKIDLRVELWHGAVLEFRSAEDPDALRGEGLHSLVGHESAFWRPEVWTEALRPALSDKLGWAALCSTPKGTQNWFAREWSLAYEEPVAQPWESSRRAFDWPTRINPRITQADVEHARLTLPDAVFRQEYLGELVSPAGSLFRIPPECWLGRREPPEAGARYAAGLDWAKRDDFTAWAVLRVDTLPWRLVEFGRVRHVEYTTQAERIAEVLKRYGNAPALADQSHETANDLLRQKGCRVSDFAITMQSRPTILQNLAVAFERAEIRMPGEDSQGAVLRGELENFTPQVTRSGNVRYEAAHGFHDDLVFALALAAEAARTAMHGQARAFLVSGGRTYRP